MVETIWTIQTEARGYFVLGRDQSVERTTPPHPALRRVAILPVLDKNRRETGVFNLEIDFMAEHDSNIDGKVGKLARNLVDDVLSMVAFSTGYPCELTKQPTVHCALSGEREYRRLFFAVPLPLGPFGAGGIGPPPLLDERILCRALTDEQRFVIGWYRIALNTRTLPPRKITGTGPLIRHVRPRTIF